MGSYIDSVIDKYDVSEKLEGGGQTDMAEFEILPFDIWTVVTKYLPIKDLFNIGRSSKLFHEIIRKCTTRTVEIEGNEVELTYVHDKYFLKLPNDGKYDNYGTYFLHKERGMYFSRWDKVNDCPMMTRFYMIRIDPKTLKVHNSDFTFSRTTGKVGHFKNFVGIPLGSCFDCVRGYSQRGKGGINLKGTIFFIKSGFKHQGYCDKGEWKFDEVRQICKIRGGGLCGYTCPEDCTDGTEEFSHGGWLIQLGVVSKEDQLKAMESEWKFCKWKDGFLSGYGTGDEPNGEL